MFEITYNDKERLNDYIGYGVAYGDGIYDFTFEDTYLIYHCEHNNQVKYIALDMRNGLDSSIITKNATQKYTMDSYSLMIPHLLYSIKYNGDRRYLQRIIDDPLDLIDALFRVVLAKNGYSVREEQIALCKRMFIGFTKKKVSLCEAEVGTGKTLAYLVAGFVARLHKYHKSNVLQPVTITTSSIELQRSIVNKEIPRLSALLQKYNIIDKPLTAVVRKGKSHYFCIRRFRNHIEQLKRHGEDYSIAISLLSELKKLPYGIDLDNYKLGNGIKDCICVKDSCKNCGMRSFCGYYSYMTKVNSSFTIDFQVTNHNLFMVLDIITELQQSQRRRDTYSLETMLINTFKSLQQNQSYVIWLDNDIDGTLFLCATPKNINSVLNNKIWNSDSSFVLTSGTMSDGNNFEYFKMENGLDRIGRYSLMETQTESPFNYSSNARLYIPEDIPYPDNDNEEYINAISERCFQLIEATNGHTAILFTSYRVLNSVYNVLKDKLSKYDVFCMTRGNKTAISDFKKSQNGVLFASGSMWEGVDCAGDILSSVIIVRLPFPMRSVLMEEKKKGNRDVSSFINEICLPNMLIKLRQGVGRLIRTENDTGVVSILDARASAYGKYHRNVTKA